MTREEALKIVRENYPHFGTTEPWLDLEKALATLIPELRESEEERTLKKAIAILKQQRDYWSYDGPIDKFPPATPRKALVDAIDVALSYLEKQKEQKPAWSEENEATIKSAVHWLEKYLSTIMAKDVSSATQDGILTVKATITNLKSHRPSWKPSEEHLSALLAIFNDPDNIGSQTCQLALSDLYEQLKKL